MITAQVDQASLDKAMLQLKSLGKRVERAVMRKAMNRLGTMALQRMRGVVPVEQGGGALGAARRGLTRKSLGKKVKVVNGVTVLIVGPRRGFKKVIGKHAYGKNKGQPIVADPVRTAHLAGPGRHQTFTEETKAAIIDQIVPIITEYIEQELAKG